MRPRTLSTLVSFGILALLGSSPAVGSCNTGDIFHGLTTTSFEQCGPDAHAFFWVQGRALQGTLGASNSLTAGHDSGRNQTEVEGMYFDGPNGGKSNGSYYASTSWGNPGVDGCILIFREADLGCAGGPDFGLSLIHI